MKECKPLRVGRRRRGPRQRGADRAVRAAPGQGLTLVHLSAHRKRFLWYKGCLGGIYGEGIYGGVYMWVYGVYGGRWGWNIYGLYIGRGEGLFLWC